MAAPSPQQPGTSNPHSAAGATHVVNVACDAVPSTGVTCCGLGRGLTK